MRKLACESDYAVMLLGSGLYNFLEMNGACQVFDEVYLLLRSVFGGGHDKACVVEKVVQRILKAGELTACHGVNADKCNASFGKNWCYLVNDSFLDTACINNNAALLEKVGIFLNEADYCRGEEGNNSNVRLGNVLCLIVDSILGKSHFNGLSVYINTAHQMIGVLFYCLAH